MKKRFSPIYWPLFALASPALVPLLAIKNQRFVKDRERADQENRERMEQAVPLDLPQLEYLKLTPLVEWRTVPGFAGEPGVSYLIQTDRGSLLFDLGFGADSGVLAANAAKLGVSFDQVDALMISHMHVDHIGGGAFATGNTVLPPAELGDPANKTCYLPEKATVQGFRPEVVERPRMLCAGLATTGPLARRLFLMGWCEEQTLLARVRGKGLVVITGCGHPGLETILAMVARLSDEPIHAVIGGLHYPLTESRLKKPGLEATMVFGTGKPPWQRINQRDLERAVELLRRARPRRLLLSAHDTCDYALEKFAKEVNAQCEVLQAGRSYLL